MNTDTKRLLLTIAIVFFLAFAVIVVASHLSAGPAEKKPFDHNRCQYPYRSTNPPNGCDNTDPCDPYDAVKGGSGECDDAELSK